MAGQSPESMKSFFFVTCKVGGERGGVTSVGYLACSQFLSNPFLRDTEGKRQEPEVNHFTVDRQIWSQLHCGVKTCEPVCINSEDIL